MSEIIELFIREFNLVFNTDFTIKKCGRQYCINLIETAKLIDPNQDFGNSKTGFMNKDNMIALYKDVNPTSS